MKNNIKITQKSIENCSAKTFEAIVESSELEKQNINTRFNYSIKALENKKVLIVGAGTLGNELTKNLVNSGVSTLTIIDFDKYEYHNLPRSPMIGYDSVGKYKAEELAKNLVERSVFPLEITAIVGDITQLGFGFFANFDLILSPVDNYPIRAYVDKGAKLMKKNHISLATGDTLSGELFGTVIVSPKNSSCCYSCSEVGTLKAIQHKHCSDMDEAVQAQVIGFSSMVGGLASTLALNMLLDENKFVNYEKYNIYFPSIKREKIVEKITYTTPFGSCNFHNEPSNFKEISILTCQRTYDSVFDALKKEFPDGQSYNFDLEDGGLYYIADRWNEPIESLSFSNEIGSDDNDVFMELPSDHIYVMTDATEKRLVRIKFE